MTRIAANLALGVVVASPLATTVRPSAVKATGAFDIRQNRVTGLTTIQAEGNEGDETHPKK